MKSWQSYADKEWGPWANCVGPITRSQSPPGHEAGSAAPHKALCSSSFKEAEKQIPLETRFHGNQLAIDNVAGSWAS